MDSVSGLPRISSGFDIIQVVVDKSRIDANDIRESSHHSVENEDNVQLTEELCRP